MASMEMESEYSMEMAVESMEYHGNLRDGEDTLYTVKPAFKDTLMRGHPLYSKTCLQETLWWEDTLYTVKPVFKRHSDERTRSIQ